MRGQNCARRASNRGVKEPDRHPGVDACLVDGKDMGVQPENANRQCSRPTSPEAELWASASVLDLHTSVEFAADISQSS